MRIYCDNESDKNDFQNFMYDVEFVLESTLTREKNQDNPDTRYIIELEELIRQYRNVQSSIDKVVVS